MADIQFKSEVDNHLKNDIIPFWKSLRDNEYGGYYGYMGYGLNLDKKAVKGCILNSRITWFFANAYTLLRDESLLDEARHGFDFLKNHCWDNKNGGVYWSLNYDGTPNETIKHTYNQAFSIYALSSYYEASGDRGALDMAYKLYDLIENKMRDELGYKEAFDEGFNEIDNDKLSENGVMAQKTMNTLLHVFEAYTELYRVDRNEKIASKIKWIMDIIADKVYNPKLHRQEVFFDDKWNSIIDLHSYGHDIETAWLVDRSTDILGDAIYSEKMSKITKDLTNQIYSVAFDGSSLANECERGVVNEWRIWWVQAETIVGFLNGYERTGRDEYLEAVLNEWKFIKEHVIDKRDGYKAGREWYWRVSKEGVPDETQPIVEPWKCPYHDGRMCFEVIRRLED
jgi:mannobiose 2-epimerase